MISKERIEQAAKEYAINDVGLKQGASYKNAITDFTAGVRFAEAELKSVAMDFAEWVELNCSALSGNLWEFVKDPNSEVFTSRDLFAKFMAERNIK